MLAEVDDWEVSLPSWSGGLDFILVPGPSAGSDDTSAPVSMLVNLSELLAVDFPLVEVRSLQLDTVVHGDRRTRSVTVRKLQGVGNSTFVLSVGNDNDFRSRCE
jgi:hypothetical protein